MKDEKRAADLIQEIGALIANDEELTKVDWESISIVVIADGGSSVSISGYWYDSSGEPNAETPANDIIFDKFSELREATQTAGKELWKTALVQITRATKKVNIEVEYDDLQRWKVTPRNYETLPKELRPK